MSYPGFNAENALIPSKTIYRGKNVYGSGNSVTPQSDFNSDDIDDDAIEDIEDLEEDDEF